MSKQFVVPNGVSSTEIPVRVLTTTLDANGFWLEEWHMLKSVNFFDRGPEYCWNYLVYSAIDWWLTVRKTVVEFDTCSVWVVPIEGMPFLLSEAYKNWEELR